jgi:hypothetical protein
MRWEFFLLLGEKPILQQLPSLFEEDGGGRRVCLVAFGEMLELCGFMNERVWMGI